jgi:hypothetical protein
MAQWTADAVHFTVDAIDHTADGYHPGRRVIGGIVQIDLTVNAASVNKTRNVTGQTQGILLTTNPASITAPGGPRTVNCTTASVRLTAGQGTVNRVTGINATTESIALTANQASVNRTRKVLTTTESIAIQSNDSTVRKIVQIPCATEQIVVTGNPATIVSGITVAGRTEHIYVRVFKGAVNGIGQEGEHIGIVRTITYGLLEKLLQILIDGR